MLFLKNKFKNAQSEGLAFIYETLFKIGMNLPSSPTPHLMDAI